MHSSDLSMSRHNSNLDLPGSQLPTGTVGYADAYEYTYATDVNRLETDWGRSWWPGGPVAPVNQQLVYPGLSRRQCPGLDGFGQDITDFLDQQREPDCATQDVLELHPSRTRPALTIPAASLDATAYLALPSSPYSPSTVAMTNGPSIDSASSVAQGLGMIRLQSQSTANSHDTGALSRDVSRPAHEVESLEGFDFPTGTVATAAVSDHDALMDPSPTMLQPQQLARTTSAESSASGSSSRSDRFQQRRLRQAAASQRPIAPTLAPGTPTTTPSPTTMTMVEHSPGAYGCRHRRGSSLSQRPRPANPRKPKNPSRSFCRVCQLDLRGPHELQRHTDLVHRATRTVFRIVDISPGRDFLRGCKKCDGGKHYNREDNAACHLRRSHFKLDRASGEDEDGKRLGGKSGGNDPPMEEIRKWLRTEQVTNNNVRDANEAEVDADAEENAPEPDRLQPLASTCPDQSSSPFGFVRAETMPATDLDQVIDSLPHREVGDRSAGDAMTTATTDPRASFLLSAAVGNLDVATNGLVQPEQMLENDAFIAYLEDMQGFENHDLPAHDASWDYFPALR